MHSELTVTSSVRERWLVIGLITLTALLPLGIYGLAQSGTPEAGMPLFRDTPRLEQLILASAVYPIKLTYMLLALVTVGLLWKQVAPSLSALRWSLVFFLIGELICWVNIVAFYEENLLLEYLHSWGMVVCLGFLVFAVLEALDSGVFHYSAADARCALVGICGGYTKSAGGPCALERLFRWTLPMTMLVALMPLTASTVSVSYDTFILGVARNLSHPVAMQWYEIRYAPLAGLVLIGTAWFVSLWGLQNNALRVAKILLAAGMGHISFAFLRLTLFSFYRGDLVWFVFWEEFTELILMLGILVAVRIFRRELSVQSSKFLPDLSSRK